MVTYNKEAHRIYVRTYRQAKREAGGDLGREAVARERVRSQAYGRVALIGDSPGKPNLTPQQEDEIAHMRDHVHTSIIGELFGDPITGRSALDRLSPQQRAELLG